ncbi:hypothetical protein KUCAC02_005712, partial [Chaenocephalus aceratus]
QIDAGAALKDCSLVQSLGTEIEAHPWQSNVFIILLEIVRVIGEYVSTVSTEIQ